MMHDAWHCPLRCGVDESTLADYDTTLAQHGRWFLWTTWKFYLPDTMVHRKDSKYALEKIAGSFDKFSLPEPIMLEGLPL